MNILEKIENKKAVLGIIGLGYVGLPLVMEFLKVGFRVIGFDIDEKKIDHLKEGRSYIRHIDFNKVRGYIQEKTFLPTSDFSILALTDCVIICVPTPLTSNKEPDMNYVFNTTEILALYLHKDHLIVLESTTYPGATEEIMKILEKTGLKAGKDFYLAYSPERIDPNNRGFNLSTIPKIIGGYSDSCLNAVKALYDKIALYTVPLSSLRAAEATKLLENIYRAVNIALVNELKVLFDRMGIDIWEVIEAAKTKPFGFQAFYPGPGFGGHCIPVDPFYLTWKAKEYNLSTKFVELAGEINTTIHDFVVKKVILALNDFKKSLKGSKILILGLAYKADIDDDRESPAYYIIERLEEMGAVVEYNDPYIPVIKKTRRFSRFEGKRSVDIKGNYDLFIIATDHEIYKDIDLLSYNIPIVDTRNLIKTKSILVYKA